MVSEIKPWGTEMKQLAPDTYAWIQGLGPGETTAGISNAGLILGPDGCLVIDTMNTPSMVRPFRARIAELTPKAINHVVLTHVHGDHTHGAYLFAEAEIIAHDRCREQLIEGGQAAIEAYAISRPQWTEELGEVKLHLPSVTINDRLTIYYGDRRIELIHMGPAHTNNDILVWLPAERILYSGDIFFFESAPLGHQGDFVNWLKVIDEVLAMPVDLIVPGHGPVGTKDEARRARGCMAALVEEAKRCFDAGYSLEEAAARFDFGPYRGWPDNVQRISQNLGSIYRTLSGETR